MISTKTQLVLVNLIILIVSLQCREMSDEEAVAPVEQQTHHDSSNSIKVKCIHGNRICEIDDPTGVVNSINPFIKRGGIDQFKYGSNDFKCLTNDCSVFTLKLKRSSKPHLACVGDRYSSGGSRCMPIEGLYLGKK